MNIIFARSGIPRNCTFVLGVIKGDIILPQSVSLPGITMQTLTKAVAVRKKEKQFTGETGEYIDLIAPADFPANRILLCGLGDPAALDTLALQRVGGCISAALMARGEKKAIIAISASENCPIEAAGQAAHLAFGASLRNYRYTKWLNKDRRNSPVLMKEIKIITHVEKAARKNFDTLQPVVKGVQLARALTDEPANSLYPAAFVKQATKLATKRLRISALLPKDMVKLGMNALLAVGGGSQYSPRLLIIQWQGRSTRKKTDIALVGKGVTFDTGGLDPKKLENMIQMKGDMAGGAAVVGTLAAMADNNAGVNAVGIVPLAENAISGSSYRPSDILRAANETTIEVTNPDAEGRLILLDALWYADKYFSPETIISIGTLSGSGIDGLGRRFGALYAEDDGLANRLLNAGLNSGERLWRLPTSSEYDEDLHGEISDFRLQADYKCGADGTFVTRLLKNSITTPAWAHIDMAWLDRNWKDEPLCPKGATGWGVRLFSQYITSTYLNPAFSQTN